MTQGTLTMTQIGRRLPRWRNKIIKLNTIVPELIEKEVGKAVEPLMLEYCKNRDCEEVLLSLEKMLMNIGARRRAGWYPPWPSSCTWSHREMTSK